jgi:hypothetical protein
LQLRCLWQHGKVHTQQRGNESSRRGQQKGSPVMFWVLYAIYSHIAVARKAQWLNGAAGTT